MRGIALLVGHGQISGTVAVVEPFLQALGNGELRCIGLVATRLLLELGDGLVESTEVSQH